jgi:hypothetical protein
MAIKIHHICGNLTQENWLDKSKRYEENQTHEKRRKVIQTWGNFPVLKNSNFCVDHNSEDRWQPRWKIP